MKSDKMLIVLACLSLLIVGGAEVRSQNEAADKGQAKKAAGVGEQKTSKSPKAKKPRGRLPNYYGQIGISEKQRETIYAIQTEYRPRIKQLAQQLEALRQQRDKEIHAVLTDEQKQRLAERLEEAEQRRARDKSSTEGKAAVGDAESNDSE